MITISDAQLIRGTKTLLDEASLTIYPGHKVGLVGANGTGKSSLLALILGQLHLDKGEISVPSQWRIATVAQETPALEVSALEYVLDGDREFRELETQLAKAEAEDNGHRIAELHGKLDAVGGYSIRARAGTLLAGLGFTEAQQSHPVKSFSGGWRMRLNLAQALLCRSELLLLDEPTNHLDLDTMYWLEGWIKSYQGTLVLISHDRDFIDAIVDEIVHVEHQKLNFYKGNYSAFEHTRAERMAQQQVAYERQQRERAHMQSFVDRFRYKASKAKQAQSRLKALERMTELMPSKADSPFYMEFREPDALPNPLVKMEDVSVGYGDKAILNKVHLNLVPGARIGLLGRNGAGKSTLIKLLSEQLSPMRGLYEPNPGLNIGYFAQHQIEFLQLDDTPLQHLQRLAPNAREQELRDFLGGFGFQGDMALAQVRPFSGGEKARLVLALLVWQRPNLLLLDEPTNHLDLEMRHALTVALQGFEGAMVIVSHDRHLLRLTCNDYYLVDGGEVRMFDGDLDDYHQWLLDAAKAATASVSQVDEASPAQDKKLQKRLEAELRQKLSPLKKRQAKLEAEQSQATDRLAELENLLADTSLYEAEQKPRLTEILAERTQLSQALEESEMNWLELQEEIDTIEAESGL
ncbi:MULTISPECIES: ABC transporter ATP-binding protein [Shewanella]|jgi:ATP-binding cassette subfamily F protein 3|uniref:Probable ATP-binding protein YheS n=1 Tax=Shewanella chilikensis TaxID=558541 RepID=A0A6G7LNK3_9GAMM|nr:MULTISPECIES: ABC transporter ATP-binding protein [Shewanella]MBO2648356.1 ABC transporter ATP-binding protein [Shewanella algae]MCA0952324.1 ABC transporter ATP-binding protein [Shewanella chilikensis]MCE9853177.1 ABC transporter ATP-binding protein [Shewanella chilikensis]MCL1155967.1 ABC transporter ATP-binding protein [Shewanella chilikensis]NKZ41399.1 ABC transporter ATP-binding protein [Shewanella algae]